MSNTLLDFSGKVVLITGGTRGIGLQIGLSFAKRGALCILTYNWGDHDEDAIFNIAKGMTNATRKKVINAAQ